MTKKEFKKKCKENKTTSYKLMLCGGVSSTIGFIIVVVTMIFSKTFNTSIIGFILGGIVAIVGIILDLIGEVMLAKEYKNISNNSKN